MGFRTVIVSSRCKIEHRLNYLVLRGEKETKIFLKEINTLIVQSTAVALTASALCELAKNNVKVIFCDEKCNPQTELVPYYGAHNTSKRYKMQIAWKEQTKGTAWVLIVRKKILNQADLLMRRGFPEESRMLRAYAEEVEPFDRTNREGHAAKVYFNCLFQEGEGRRSDTYINGCLNYGYAVLLSALNREIAASGYLTQLGIWHDNEFNSFNLSCDLIEPLRAVADETAFSLELGDPNFKKKMANILNYHALMRGKSTSLDVAIREYVRSFFDYMNADGEGEIAFPEAVEIERDVR